MSKGEMEKPHTKMVEIVLNGQTKPVPEGCSLQELLGFLEIDPSRVAIERNREIVRKNLWAETMVAPGDQLEVVWFVGGG
ncbi:MAG: sulfur carrier protein ThiS [Acidobacteriota bacterium]